MADLSVRERDRAQIMLVAGFVLAVSFIALAVMLNSVIYTENLATRGEDARGSEAIAYRADMVAGTEQLIEHANENEAMFADRRDLLKTSIESMDDGTAPIAAIDGIRTETELMSTTQGTLIGQFNASRNFTNVGGDPDWELADSIEGTRAFRINITDSDELDETSPFMIRVDDGTDLWRVQIYNQSGTANTTLDVVGGPTCDIGGLEPEIDVVAGSVDDQECAGYEFASNVSGSYMLEFQDSNDIQGNFSVVVNSTSYTAGNYNSDRDSPFADDQAIYAATIHVLHESSAHRYETDARAVPGENDA